MKKILLICFALVSAFAQAQWTPKNILPTNSALNSIFFPTANTGYAVGYDYNSSVGIIIKTIDGGDTWDTLSSGTVAQLNSVYFPDTNTGYVVGGAGDWENGAGIILKTIDGGKTWNTLWSDTSSLLNSVFFTDVATGYAVGYDFNSYVGKIIKTIDGGATWDTLSRGTDDLRQVFFADVNTGYATGGRYYNGGDFGTFLKTTDGGTTWTTISSVPNFYSIYFTNADTGYGVGGKDEGGERPDFRGYIYKTTDGGITWTCLLSGIGEIIHSVYFTDTNTGYAACSRILKTIDGGATWIEVWSGSGGVNSFFFTETNTGYAVGYEVLTGGTILKTTNGGGLVSIKETSNPQSSFTIYPNPASTKISITTTSNKSNEQVQISIFSINGQLIRSDKFQKPERFDMDVSTMQKGIYLMRIQSTEGVETQKLVLQ
jgi:photosystem II stability/assembly factor-like uncharacterized protein